MITYDFLGIYMNIYTSTLHGIGHLYVQLYNKFDSRHYTQAMHEHGRAHTKDNNNVDIFIWFIFLYIFFDFWFVCSLV